jgi:hypothetical protein
MTGYHELRENAVHLVGTEAWARDLMLAAAAAWEAREALIAALLEALRAERAYHFNNSGENAARRRNALAALPKGWQHADL